MRRFLVTSGFRQLQESKVRTLGFANRFAGIYIDALDEPNRRGKHGFFQDILSARIACGPTKCSGWGTIRIPKSRFRRRLPVRAVRLKLLNVKFPSQTEAVESEAKLLRRQAGLPDNGAGCADGQFFLRMWYNGDASTGIAIFGVAPFWETKTKPCCWSTRMTSPEPSRLGIHRLLTHIEVADRREEGIWFALEIEFNGLLEIGNGFFAGFAETRNVHVEALADKEFVFAVNHVGHLFQATNLADGSTGGNHALTC